MLDTENHEPRPGLRLLVTNRLVQILAAASFAYWLVSWAGVSGTTLIEIMTWTLAGVLLVVAYRWSMQAAAELARGGSGGRAQLMVGVVSLSISTVGVLVWTLVWRNTGYPDWMIIHPFLGFMRMWSVAGGLLMLTAPGAVHGQIPIGNWKYIALACLVAGVLLGIALSNTIAPRITGPFAEHDSPYPQCPPEKQVIVSQERKYHDLDSPHRGLIERPYACYRTVIGARLAGYPPAR